MSGISVMDKAHFKIMVNSLHAYAIISKDNEALISKVVALGMEAKDCMCGCIVRNNQKPDVKALLDDAECRMH